MNSDSSIKNAVRAGYALHVATASGAVAGLAWSPGGGPRGQPHSPGQAAGGPAGGAGAAREG